MLSRAVLRASVLHLRASSSSFSSKASAPSPYERSPDQQDITNMDLLEERIRQRKETREFTIGGQTQRWNYRSEVVGKHGLDNDHRYIWIAYSIIILFGFGAFVFVKSSVVLSRKEEMEERDRIRKSLNLLGADRKKIGVVDN